MTNQVSPPEPGEIQIVALLGASTFVSWAPADTVEALMDAFERRMSLGEGARTSLETQMRVRLWAVDTLRSERAGTAWGDVVAAGCLWLSLRHHSGAAEMRKGVDAQLATSGVVVTASIGESPGALPGTAWSFMVGDRIHDGRMQLAATPHSQVVVMREGVTVSVTSSDEASEATPSS